MKPAQFYYHTPRTVGDAIAILAEVAPVDGRIIAGGQSLVPAMAFRIALPPHLVDINNVESFDRLVTDGGELSIGACVRHAAFDRNVREEPLAQLLAHVSLHIGHLPIRTRGTFCGSLANADPASEWCLVASTLDARLIARSVRGARTIEAGDYFRGIMTTALEPDELLTEARLPVPPRDTRWGFFEFSRRAGDFAVVMALATFRLEDGVIVEPHVGLGGIEVHARRIADAEAALRNRPPTNDVFCAAAEAAAGTLNSIDDRFGTVDYKRDLTRTAIRRALEMTNTSP